KHPVAIKLPGGAGGDSRRSFPTDYSELNRSEVTRHGSKVAIIGAGTFFRTAEEAADILADSGVNATVINPRFLSGLDIALLDELKANHVLTVTVEDGVLSGGFGEKVAAYYGRSAMRVGCYGLPKEFRDRFNASELVKECRMTAGQIASDILGMLGAHSK
ncbi:MAG: 1-deoxy-D-xylulose-5-phosphate synthase, partial [Muribaculaceae bacterium]|nr:1-deoxy-D-xylulose-5-phosphate synthase [Muribaculaceae bacterium]